MNEQVLSCIQPTGEMHLGNYFGAIKNWVELQKDYNTIYGIVDLHAMTMPFEPEKLRSNTISMAIDLLSCGVDQNNIFIQSLIPEHAELYWILGCITSFGELSRQVQFKDKSQHAEEAEQKGIISCGLFTYPVLQAADILLYKADKVPVGRDQKQHLELARNIAGRFNSTFQIEYFKEPEPLFTDIPDVKSLADPSKKMSKSLGPKHYIGIFDDEDLIAAKIQQAVTGAGENGEMSAGVANIFRLLNACGNSNDYDSLLAEFNGGTLKYSKLKTALTESLILLTKEFRRNRKSYLENSDVVEKIITNTSMAIREKARKTLFEVKQIVGLSNSLTIKRT